MFYTDLANNRYYLGRPFKYGDIQYTAAGATHAKFAELGFNQVTVQARPDDRFYIVTGPDANGQYAATPRDIDELKSEYVKRSKLAARTLLAKTDWLVIRKEENANSIPAAVETFRDQVRTISDDNCTLINGCADVAALETLINTPALIQDGNNQGSYIANTDSHLASFPEEVGGYDY